MTGERAREREVQTYALTQARTGDFEAVRLEYLSWGLHLEHHPEALSDLPELPERTGAAEWFVWEDR